MKLETKLGIYAIMIILLSLIGLSILLYPFEYYSILDTKTENTNVSLIAITTVFGTKVIGVLFIYIANKIYNKHFKLKKL